MKLAIFFFPFILFFSFFFSFSLAIPSDEPQPHDINYWCGTTPNPDTCRAYVVPVYAPMRRAEFLVMAVEAAMTRALYVQERVKDLQQHCRSKRKKLVWMDCSKLLDDTVFQLNRTLDGLKDRAACSDYDTQTWLSASLTKLETCRTGSNELNESDFITPAVKNITSELISNCLEINGKLLGEQETPTEDFPVWLPARERKMLASRNLAAKANYIVAQDGSGNFRSIQAAINYATSRRFVNRRIIIHIKRGVYRENVQITNRMSKLTIVGDGIKKTIVTGSRSVSSGFTTYSSATFGVDGVGFIARGITFRNTAGPQNSQAVALRSASDLSVFYSCGFEGYQDTLFVHAQRQFFKACYIYGTIDFIFGNAAVVFQNCMIYVRKPKHGQANIITAQGRGDPFQNTGISIQNSRVMAAPDLAPILNSVKTYLGRPWQEFSRTVFIKTYLDKLVHPQGWSPWLGTNFAQNTLYYGEYRNMGPGSSTRKRVKWRGYHVIKTAKVANPFTVSNLIAGRAWLPDTGVPFTAGL